MACDAGALAGRKMMGKQAFTAAALAEANTFFDTNFVDGSYGSRDLERVFTETDGIVEGQSQCGHRQHDLGPCQYRRI